MLILLSSFLSPILSNHPPFLPPHRLTTLDAVVYGHFQAILSLSLPSSELAKVVSQFRNLTDFCNRTLQPEKEGLVTVDQDSPQIVDQPLLTDSVHKMDDESIQHES